MKAKMNNENEMWKRRNDEILMSVMTNINE